MTYMIETKEQYSLKTNSLCNDGNTYSTFNCQYATTSLTLHYHLTICNTKCIGDILYHLVHAYMHTISMD